MVSLTGNEIANTINGNAGNNILDGKGGGDVLSGLGGNDTYRVDNAADQIIEAVGNGTDRVLASVNYTLGSGREVEFLQAAYPGPGPHGLGLTGNQLKNTIIGGSRDDVLVGNGGDDTLIGNAGHDILQGGTGKDVLSGGAGIDTLVIAGLGDLVAGEVYNGGAGVEDALTTGNFSGILFDLSNVTLSNLESLSIINNDVALKAAQLNAFTRRVTADSVTLTSGGLVDLTGTTVNVGTFNLHDSGNTLIFEQDNNGGGPTVNGDDGNDTVTLTAVSSLIGGNLNGGGGNDILTGASNEDFLNGGAGNDVLRGGGGGIGADRLTGGSGADIFLGEFLNGPEPQIEDFSGITAFGGGAGEGDKIRFSGLGTGTYIGDAAFVNGNGFQNSRF